MGLCYSKSGWLSADASSFTDCASTSNSKSLIYDSPRWSAETGDKGKLAALFYRSRRRRRRQSPDLFAARLLGVMKAAHSPTGEHFAIASFVGTPFVRSLEIQGMDTLARSYAISAAKASARNAFLLLQEQDKAEEVEVFSPRIQIQSDSNSGDAEEEAEEEQGVDLDSPEDGDEIQVLEPEKSDHSDSEFSEFIELYRSDPPRSFFESCFPATGRWASVVNAAMQSACVPRNYQSSPARSRHNCTEASEFSDCLEFEIRTMQQPRISAGSETCSDVGHACVGCCGSRASLGRSNSDSSEAGHGCCGSASASSRSRAVKSETGSSSDVVQILQSSSSTIHALQEVEPEPFGNMSQGLKANVTPMCGSSGAILQEQEPCSTIHALQDMEEPFVNMFTPTHGLKVNVRSMCRSPGALLPEREPSLSATRALQDMEEPFVIISTPTHGLKVKEEAGLSMCRSSGAKLEELEHVERRETGSSSGVMQSSSTTRALQEREEPFVNMCTPTHGLKVDIMREEEGLSMCRVSGARLERETGSSSDVVQMLQGQSSCSTIHVLQEMEKEEPFVNVSTPTHGWKVNATSTQRDDRLERVDSDLDAFFSFPSSPSAKILDSGHIIEEMKSAKLMEDMGLRKILDDEPSEDEFEGPRIRAESPRSGNALSKGAFGSPFPILITKTKPLIDKKLKLFSLDRANTAALTRKREGSFDGVLTSSSESYLDTSSSSLSRPTTHDWDDYSSDLFEIHDMKAFSGVCLPLKKSFGCGVNEGSSSCDGSFSEVESASSCNSSALKYQVRGANAVRGADTRAKILREQATKKATAERTRVQLPPEPVKPQSKGISVMVLSLLRGKQQPPSGNKTRPTKPGAVHGKSIKPGPSDVLSVNYVSSFELKGKSIKALSIRDVLESQEKQNGH